jgi:hypothetical protein
MAPCGTALTVGWPGDCVIEVEPEPLVEPEDEGGGVLELDPEVVGGLDAVAGLGVVTLAIGLSVPCPWPKRALIR